MKSVVLSLFRKHFSRLHPEAANLDCCEKLLPRCRFMQYTHSLRKKVNQKGLGMVSEDGTRMIELSNVTCAAPDMIQFIQQRYCMDSLLDSVQFMECTSIDPCLRLLPPIGESSKIIGVNCNYYDSCDEQNKRVPKEPSFFVKFSSSIVGALDCIRAHSIAKHIDYGCQLGVVIGKKCRNVTKAEAMNYVFGYLIAQDITARDWRSLLGGQLMLGKSLDTFCPLGPVIVHKCHLPDVYNLWIKTHVNGKERQVGTTKNMIFKIDYLIHRLSQFLTLSPGDLILTGTPAGIGACRSPSAFLKPGDVVESEIQNLGKMCNRVVNPYE